MYCPRCDKQGFVYKGFYPEKGIYLYACNECDACWEEGEEISIKRYDDLSTYLERNGLIYGISKVEKDYSWDKK